jgi:hypothetical protein
MGMESLNNELEERKNESALNAQDQDFLARSSHIRLVQVAEQQKDSLDSSSWFKHMKNAGVHPNLLIKLVENVKLGY